MLKILLIDDDPVIQLVLTRTLQKDGYDVTIAHNGEEGIALVNKLNPALILCDWMMPIIDGLEVCRYIKANPNLSTIFFILLTARGDVEDRIQGLDAGADDFISKPIEINELKARVRAGLRLYQLNNDLRSKKQALEILNQKLKTELAEAAEYVRSLLPTENIGNIDIESLFIPSAELGGDCFDYYQLDKEHLAMYLLDVSGHGVGSALLSVSVLNVLRSCSLPHTNFYQPSQVLNALNTAFQGLQGDKFFTIWYGVYNIINRQLIYANAGHPPAIMISDITLKVEKLGSPGLPVGILPEGEFENEYINIPENSSLYIFSDGAYEIHQPDGNLWSLNEFIELLVNYQKANIFHLDHLLEQIKVATSTTTLEDDLSLLKLSF